MKFKYFILAFCLSVATSFMSVEPAHAETETACERNADGAIIVGNQGSAFVTDTNGNTGNSCKEVPDFYKIQLFRFGLCSQNPYLNNNSLASCTFLLNSDAGVDHVIEGTGNSATLDTSTADSPIAIGSYNFMVIVLKNELQVKHTEQFSRTLTGKTSSGITCWTTNSITSFTNQRSSIAETNPNVRSSLGMDCGAAGDAAPEYTTEVFDSFSGGPNSPFEANMVGNNQWVRLMKSNNLDTADTADNGARILFVQSNNAEVTLTSSFTLKFTLTDAVSIDMENDNGTIYAIKNGADPFQVSLTITN
jgi:hypothetical protein